MNQFNHIPPSSIEYEQSLICGILHNENVIDDIRDVVAPEDFYNSPCRILYQAALSLIEKNIKVEMTSIFEHLKEIKKLDAVGGAAHIIDIFDNVPFPANAAHYSKTIRKKAVLRDMIIKLNAGLQSCYEDADDEAISKIQSDILNINSGIDGKIEAIGDIFSRRVDHYEKISKQHGLTGIATGYDQLDFLTSGFQKSTLVIVAARPGMGKTSFAVSCALNMAKDETPVLFFSLEMSKGQIIDRCASVSSKISTNNIRSGIRKDEWAKLIDAGLSFNDMPFFLDDTPVMHYQELETKARKMVNRHGIKIIFIDYLQYLTGSDKSSKNNEMGEVTRGLKSMAKRFDIPVIALCQLSRECEKRGKDKRPILSDLRDSGSIEQDSDIVMFLYRPEYYDENEEPGICECLVRKHRNGENRKIKLGWEPATTEFKNLIKNGFYDTERS